MKRRVRFQTKHGHGIGQGLQTEGDGVTLGLPRFSQGVDQRADAAVLAEIESIRHCSKRKARVDVRVVEPTDRLTLVATFADVASLGAFALRLAALAGRAHARMDAGEIVAELAKI